MLDPVVRLCAAEVRKRLAQYYQSPAHGGELRIDLNPGSYVPVFSQPAPDAPVVEAIPPELPADVPSKAEQVSQPRRTRKIYWPAGLIASGVIIVVIFVLDSFWALGLGDTSRNKSPLSKKSGLRCSPAASLSCSVWAKPRSCLPLMIPR